MKIDTTTNGDKRAGFNEGLLGDGTSPGKLPMLYVGHHLGFYRALANSGELTEQELAELTGNRPEFAREWLQQQTIDGAIAVIHPGNNRGERRYYLPRDVHAVLANADGASFLPWPLEVVDLHTDPAVNHWLQMAPLPAAEQQRPSTVNGTERVRQLIRDGINAVWTSLKPMRKDSQSQLARC